MSEVSDWKTIDIENVRIDNLTLSAPQGSYWQKVMGAVKRMFNKMGDPDDLVTTDKSSIVAAVNEVAAGGSDVPGTYSLVYSTELEADTAGNFLTIESEDIGGKYLDVVVFVDFIKDAEATVPITGMGVGLFSGDAEGAGFWLYSDTVTPSMPSSMLSAGVESAGGLARASVYRKPDGYVSGDHAKTYYEPTGYGSGRLYQYPEFPFSGVSEIEVETYGATSGTKIPAGTKIMVYARRKVLESAGGE